MRMEVGKIVIGMWKAITTYLFSQLKRQLAFFTILVIIAVISIIGIVTYLVSIQLQINDATIYDTNQVRQIGNNMEQVIKSFNGLINRVSMNHNNQGNRVTANLDFQTLLKHPYRDVIEKYSTDDDMRRIAERESLFSDGLDFLYVHDLSELRVRLDFFANSVERDEYLLLNPSRYDRSGRISWYNAQDFIVANRAILDVGTFEIIGYLSLGVRKDYLQQMIQDTPGRNLYILDNNNDVILHGVNSGQQQLADLIAGKPQKETLVTSYTSPDLGWHVLSMVSLSQIAKGPSLIGKWIVIIGFGGMLIGILLSLIVSTRLVRSMNTLRSVMEQVDRDNFNIRVNITRRDELGRVGRSFNKMMDKVNSLISTVYQSQIHQKEAEFKALQAQINPHFLYNTLETIRWLAEFGETEQIEKVSVALSKLMKTSISNHKPFYLLQEELDYIQDYLYIQRIRFQDKINVFIHMEPGILDSVVPRLILQPLVENAIIHGLEPKLGTGHLYIKGSLQKENGMKLEVIDDGVGLDQVQLALFRDNLRQTEKKGKGSGNGMINVHERIRLLYGEQYGIAIESTPEIGTMVEIYLPYSKSIPSLERSESNVQSDHY